MKVNFTTNFEYAWQAGYPYALIDDNGKAGDVYYNDPGSYDRILSSTSLLVENHFENFTMTNTTGFQYFDDHMKLDQDFTEKSIFTLNQKQKQHSSSHEIILKSRKPDNFKWLMGAFGFFQRLHTNAPVDFKKEGIDDMINSNIQIPTISMGPMGTVSMYDSLINNNMIIAGNFKTPAWGVAAFTQLTYDNLFVEGFPFRRESVWIMKKPNFITIHIRPRLQQVA